MNGSCLLVHSDSNHSKETVRRTLVASSLILVAVWTVGLQFSSLFSMSQWALGDNGGHLTLARLLDDGAIPNVDFAYSYGPLAILINWFSAIAFGNSPTTFIGIHLVVRLATVLLFAFISARMIRSTPLQLIAIFAIPFFFGFDHSIAHAIERLLIVAAASFAVLKLPSHSIAMLGCAAMVRPAAAVIGCGLFVCIQGFLAVRERGKTRESMANWLNDCLWLICTQSLILIIYTVNFGFESFCKTAIPTSGMRMYSTMKRVIPFSDFQTFFPENQNLRGYLLGNPSHIIPLLLLTNVGFAIYLVVHFVRRTQTDDETSGLPGAFVILAINFIAITITYKTIHYYTPLLWICIPTAFAINQKHWTRIGSPLFLLLGLQILACTAFTAMSRLPDVGGKLSFAWNTDGLPVEADLARLRGLLKEKRLAIRTIMGEPSLLRSIGVNVSPTPYWCFRNGFNLPHEVEKARAFCQETELIVTRKDQGQVVNLLENACQDVLNETQRYVIWSRKP